MPDGLFESVTRNLRECLRVQAEGLKPPDPTVLRILDEAYEHFQEQEATLSNRLQENLAGVRVVKAFARQLFEKEMFGKKILQRL